MPKLEQIVEMLKAEPGDVFLQYALGMEYMKLGQPQHAIAAFEQLLRGHPDYVPAYFMAGRAAEQDGEPERAKDFYRQGIAAAKKTGDTHAAGEISAALDAIS